MNVPRSKTYFYVNKLSLSKQVILKKYIILSYCTLVIPNDTNLDNCAPIVFSEYNRTH